MAELEDGRMLTGAVKWNRRAVGADVFVQHLRMLDRLAIAGLSWAHEARKPDAPFLFVAAEGFSPAFLTAARASGHPVTVWTLKDLYSQRLK